MKLSPCFFKLRITCVRWCSDWVSEIWKTAVLPHVAPLFVAQCWNLTPSASLGDFRLLLSPSADQMLMSSSDVFLFVPSVRWNVADTDLLGSWMTCYLTVSLRSLYLFFSCRLNPKSRSSIPTRWKSSCVDWTCVPIKNSCLLCCLSCLPARRLQVPPLHARPPGPCSLPPPALSGSPPPPATHRPSGRSMWVCLNSACFLSWLLVSGATPQRPSPELSLPAHAITHETVTFDLSQASRVSFRFC